MQQERAACDSYEAQLAASKEEIDHLKQLCTEQAPAVRNAALLQDRAAQLEKDLKQSKAAVKREEVKIKADRLQTGLDKLSSTEAVVSSLKEECTRLEQMAHI